MGKIVRSLPIQKLAVLVVTGILLAVGNYVFPQFVSLYYGRIFLLCGLNIILAVSLNLINGFTGQFSLGHAAFMAVGAYSSAVLTHYKGQAILDAMTGAGIPLWLANPILLTMAIAVAVIFSGLVGLLVGLPSLRLKGDYLAIVTLGFGEAIRSIIENVDVVGAARGFPGIPMITGFAWIYLGVVGVILFSRSLALSTHGRALFAIREDELAAEAVGINTFKYKVIMFAIGAAWAGVAGTLYAHLEGNLNPSVQTIGFMKSVEIVIMVVLGGMGSVTGAMIAAVVVTALPEVLRRILGDFPGMEDYRMVIYSLLFIILMLTRPQGIFGRHEFSPVDAFRKLTGRKRRSSDLG